MKRWLVCCWMIALCALMLGPGALAAEGDAIVGSEDGYYFSHVFAVGDTLYLPDYSGVYTYQIGDADLTAHPWQEDGGRETLEAQVRGDDEERTLYTAGSDFIFADGDAIYSIDFVMESDDQGTRIAAAFLSRIELTEDGAARVDSEQIEWPEELIVNESYGGSHESPLYAETYVAVGGQLCIYGYGGQGEVIGALDLQTMKFKSFEVQSPRVLFPYDESRVLVGEYDRSGDGGTLLNIVDPATGKAEEFGRVNERLVSGGIAFSPETGELYAITDGMVCQIDPATGDPGEGLVDMPLPVYGNTSGCILSGQYYVAATGNGVLIRNLKAESKPERRLKVCDDAYLDSVTKAYIDFSNVHGDVSVAIARGMGSNDVVEEMMNRSSDTDVFAMSLSSSSYGALLNRGFLAELDSSEALVDATRDMYPAILDKITRDGRLVAIPVQAFSWGFGVNEAALERIGLTMDDVPDNWVDFLDFLSDTLPEHMAQDPEVRLYYDGYDSESMRQMMLGLIFESYITYADYTMDVPSYDTELLHTLLDKIEAIDFTALGLNAPDAYEDEDSATSAVIVGVSGGGMLENAQLFDFSTCLSFGNGTYDYTPVLMAMEEGAPALLSMDLYVACVNPYSENQDLAVEFLEDLWNNVPQSMKYNFLPALDEPVRQEYWEESYASFEEDLKQLNENLESAEPADRQAIEESIASLKESMEHSEQYSWEVSPQQIEWFRAHDDEIAVTVENWLYSDNSGEALDLMQQYVTGQIGVDQFLSGVDRIVRMRAMEGAY